MQVKHFALPAFLCEKYKTKSFFAEICFKKPEFCDKICLEIVIWTNLPQKYLKTKNLANKMRKSVDIKRLQTFFALKKGY